jgi:hypothetical protein
VIPSAEALAEAEAVLVAFQAALVRLGIKSIVAILKTWRTVPANKAVEQTDEWLDGAVGLVMTNRARGRELAVAYYRLAAHCGPARRSPIPTTRFHGPSLLVSSAGSLTYFPSPSTSPLIRL